MEKVKRNVFTLVIDHDEAPQPTAEVLSVLEQLNNLLSELHSKDGIHRADYDIDLWEDVSEEY